jgi:hypothetical protein
VKAKITTWMQLGIEQAGVFLMDRKMEWNRKVVSLRFST